MTEKQRAREFLERETERRGLFIPSTSLPMELLTAYRKEALEEAAVVCVDSGDAAAILKLMEEQP